MPMRNPERAIAGLTGEVHALFMVIQALVKTHPAPEMLSIELESIRLTGPAQMEANPVPDAAVQTYYDTIAAIHRALAANPSCSPKDH